MGSRDCDGHNCDRPSRAVHALEGAVAPELRLNAVLHAAVRICARSEKGRSTPFGRRRERLDSGAVPISAVGALWSDNHRHGIRHDQEAEADQENARTQLGAARRPRKFVGLSRIVSHVAGYTPVRIDAEGASNL